MLFLLNFCLRPSLKWLQKFFLKVEQEYPLLKLTVQGTGGKNPVEGETICADIEELKQVIATFVWTAPFTWSQCR